MRIRFLVLPVLLALVAADCGSSDSSSSGGGSKKLNLVAYSTPQEAYEAVLPAFAKTPAGKGADVSTSFGPSGDQARAVVSGQPADVVAFSLAPDMDKLVDAKLVSPSWSQDSYQGNVTHSVVALVFRKGNPKGIRDWSDLVKPGVKVVIPNIFTSGGAKWDVMAAYGAAQKAGQDPKAYLKKLYQNVAVQPRSAREALQTFTGGEGDVLISYENEAITAHQKGQDVGYVVPGATIRIDNPIAATKAAPPVARAFVKYLRTRPAQQIFADKGYRPVLGGVKPHGGISFPKPKNLYTIDDLGGWKKANDELFDPDKGFLAKVFQQIGVPTGG